MSGLGLKMQIKLYVEKIIICIVSGYKEKKRKEEGRKGEKEGGHSKMKNYALNAFYRKKQKI